MIKGVHAMFYSKSADELREFLREKLGLRGTDTGGGWWIFNAPEVEVACHPSDDPRHDISFYCDDIDETVRGLKAKGVEFSTDIEKNAWGRSTVMILPGGLSAELYQATYKT